MTTHTHYADFKQGLLAGFPVFFGYLPASFAYALAASRVGLSLWETVLMSLLVYAGASQMMAVGMIGEGASPVTIVIATFIVNLRHFIMSTCVFNRMDKASLFGKSIAAFGVTDEGFAVFMGGRNKPSSLAYFFGIFLVTYGSWVSGSFLGGVAVTVLPKLVSDSLGIALYAVFVALLVPSVKKNLRLLILVMGTGGLNALLRQFISGSWALILATLLAALIGVYFVDLADETVADKTQEGASV